MKCKSTSVRERKFGHTHGQVSKNTVIVFTGEKIILILLLNKKIIIYNTQTVKGLHNTQKIFIIPKFQKIV